MIDKKYLEAEMEKRGYTLYASIGKTKVQFVSDIMYKVIEPKDPIINIIVDLTTGEFHCVYNLDKSINQLTTPNCSPVLNNDHFNKIVSRFMESVRVLDDAGLRSSVIEEMIKDGRNTR